MSSCTRQLVAAEPAVGDARWLWHPDVFRVQGLVVLGFSVWVLRPSLDRFA